MRGLLAAFALLLLAGCMMVQPAEEPASPAAESVIEPQKANIAIEFTRVPEEVVEEGEAFVVTWYVDSDVVKRTESTAIYYGEESGTEVTLGNVSEPGVNLSTYPNSTEPQRGTVPGAYDAGITAGEKDIYMRAHVSVEGEDYWTGERKVAVRAIPLNLSVRITGAPAEINSNLGFDVKWEVASNKEKPIERMELRYGTQPGVDVGAAAYPESISIEGATAPGSFSVRMEPPKIQAIMYFRVHLMVDSKEYWSDEVAVRLVQTLIYTSGF